MPSPIRTCLWFADNAEAAVAFYTGLVPGSRIEERVRPSPDAPPILIHFTLASVPYTALQAQGGPAHNEAASIAYTAASQAEADAAYDALLDAGGREVQCGWVTDAWGISWQVIPDGFVEAMFGGDAEANRRAFVAMQGMKRLDIAALRAAAAGP